MTNHDKYMELCCRLATAGRGTTDPNPLVGAVIVDNDRIRGTGYHARAGGPHAEPLAINEAGPACRGATLYVSLEPCCHHGRTPPCTDAIINAGISRVIIGELDPNPCVQGGGADRLRAAGIDVVILPPSPRVRRLNLPFRRWIATGQPLITWKYACSLDGRLAGPDRRPFQLSGPVTRTFTHRLRAAHHAIIVGSGTVLADDPRLTVRPPVTGRSPRPVIFDSRARTPVRARLLRGPAKPVIITTSLAPAEHRERLAAAGADVVLVPDRVGRCDIQVGLRELAARNIQTALLESGGQLAASLLRADAVDRFAAIVTPWFLGGGPAPVDQPLPSALSVSVAGHRQIGDDLVIIGWLPLTGGVDECSQASWSAWDRSLASTELLAFGP